MVGEGGRGAEALILKGEWMKRGQEGQPEARLGQLQLWQEFGLDPKRNRKVRRKVPTIPTSLS